MAVVRAAAIPKSFLAVAWDPPTRRHAKNDPLRQLMRVGAYKFAFAKSRGNPRSRLTHTLYIRLRKKCHPKYSGSNQELFVAGFK